MQALDALCSAVPPEMWSVIADKETAKEAWEAIATMRIGDDRVKKTSAQNLRRQFDSATFKEEESIEDYALRLNNMASTLTTLGDKVGESQVVEKLIRSVPQHFRQIVVAITTLLDVSTLTVVELTGRLKASEDAFEPLTCHFCASLKHKDDSQTKFIKPNSQIQDIIIKYWASIGSIHREQG